MILSTREIKKIFDNNNASLPDISVRGWIRFNRDSGKIGFIDLIDGSNLSGVQIVYKAGVTSNFELATTARVGAAIFVKGTVQASFKNPAVFELSATEFTLLKQCDEDYPLQKKQHTMEFLREIAHLRTRTKTIQAVSFVRNRLAFAIHTFFQDNGFMWVSTPILTSNDCEGAGENFTISENPDKPFFTPAAKLTVSGQLNAEAYAMGFSRVYTFGPTFRAERSHTNRHMSEFWMIEPEIAFIDLEQLISIIEVLIKTIVKDAYDNCKESFEFFSKDSPVVKERIHTLLNRDFLRISYAQVIDLLTKAVQDGYQFEDNNIFFGKDLGSEHERYICEKIYNAPVFVYNYPKEIKSFYMKVNPDNRTVSSTDLLVPGVGEIVGGSQREDNYDVLTQRAKECGINSSTIQWYVDLRKYGYSSSAGFGLGFERLIMYILNLENIKDAIPFPRTEGEIKF